MTQPILAPDGGGLLDPAWAQEVTDRVNAHEDIFDGVNPAGGWVDSDVQTSDSGNSLAEQVISTLTASLTAGYLYELRGEAACDGSAATVICSARIRMDSLTGTQLDGARDLVAATGDPTVIPLVAFYQPDYDEERTFVMTLDSLTGTGHREHGAGNIYPQLFTIELASKTLVLT